METWQLNTGHKVVSAWDLSHDLDGVFCSLLTHAQAATSHIVDGLPTDTELHDFVRLGDRLRTNDKLSSVGRALVRQISREHLLLGTHELAHRDLNLTDRVIATTTIAINHHKLEVLNFLEEVGNLEGGLEVRIQLVLDLLSIANLHPAIVPLLVQDALWVRLAERVQILQLASGHEQIDLHHQRLSLNHIVLILSFLFLVN